jgi:hypothetical protein
MAYETFAHFFFDCPATKQLNDKIISKYFTALVNQNEHEKRRFGSSVRQMAGQIYL